MRHFNYNYNYNQNHNLFTPIRFLIITIIVVLVTGCGGGEGDSSSNDSVTIAVETPQATSTTTNTTSDTTTNDAVVAPLDESEATPVYTPDTDKLVSQAESSEALFVEPTFNFDGYKTITVDITAVNEIGNALSSTLLSIYAIDDGVVELSDEKLQNMSLITKSITNSAGAITLTSELPDTVTNLLLELNTLGIENEVIYSIAETTQVSHHFD